MAQEISDKMIDELEILAKLDLSGEERERVRKDLGQMLDYIGRMNELDTEGVEPLYHVMPAVNVFREDEETGSSSREESLAGAPEAVDGCFRVPRTVE